MTFAARARRALRARLRLQRTRAGSESGFTLVEMITAITILGIVIVPLAMAIALGYRTTFGVEQKLGQSGDAQVLSAYFPEDVQSVDADGINPTDPINQEACPERPLDGEGSLITFLWDQDLGVSGQSVARYVTKGRGVGSELIRRFCKGIADPIDIVVARNFGSGSSQTGPDAATFLVENPGTVGETQSPACAADGSSCFVEINGDYKFRLDVNRRVPGVSGAASTPGKPTNAHAISGNRRATVYWDPPASNGGSPITGYYIEQTPGGTVSGPYAGSGVQINGLTNGQSYTFRVRATNVVGSGPYSEPTAAVNPAATTPDAPLVGTATADPAVGGRATVDWSLPVDYNDGGSPLLGFKVYAQVIPNPPVTADVNDPAARSGAVTGLADNTRYTLQVSARNALGEGSQSALSNEILTLPGKPGISSASGTSTPGQLRVTFPVPAGGNFSDLTGFRAHVHRDRHGDRAGDARDGVPRHEPDDLHLDRERSRPRPVVQHHDPGPERHGLGSRIGSGDQHRHHAAGAEPHHTCERRGADDHAGLLRHRGDRRQRPADRHPDDLLRPDARPARRCRRSPPTARAEHGRWRRRRSHRVSTRRSRARATPVGTPASARRRRSSSTPRHRPSP